MAKYKYKAISVNDAKVEIEGFDFVFDKSSKIIAKPAQGADYFNPNTNRITRLTGAVVYDPITLEGLLSKEQFEKSFLPWLGNGKATGGEISATHIIGDIKTILLQVRYLGHEYGDMDRLSNDAAKLIMTISFEGTKTNSANLLLNQILFGNQVTIGPRAF